MDWKRKLSSRKFWLAVAAFVAGLFAYFGGYSEADTNQIEGLIMAGGAVVSYIIAEGFADASNKTTNTNANTNNVIPENDISDNE